MMQSPTGACLRDLLNDLRTRFAGLAGAEQQVRQFGADLAQRLNQASDISAITAAFVQLEATLDQTKANALSASLSTQLLALRQQLDIVDAGPRLVALASAKISVSRNTVTAWVGEGDPNGVAVLALLDRFDPLDSTISAPMHGLARWQDLLGERLDNLSEVFEGWDETYHAVHSPLTDLRRSGMTTAELRTFLQTEIETKFTDFVAPLFGLIDHFRIAFDRLIGHIDDFISSLEDQVNAIASVGDALEDLRVAFNRLVDRLQNFDITFLADEVEDIFDAFKAQLEAISPIKIGQILDATFQELLDTLDLDKLLGISALDDEHLRIIDFMRERDPKVLIEDLVQPEFDKIIAFLRLFDLSEPIGTFLTGIEGLETELGTELHLVADAYEGLVDVIPSDLQGSLQGSISITAAA